MSLTFTQKDFLVKNLIRRLDNETVIRQFANHEFEGILKRQGQTVTVQQLGDALWTRGGTAGSDITRSNFVISSYDLTITESDQINIPITDIEEIRYNRNAESDTMSRITEALMQIMDSFTAQLAVTEALAANKLNGSTPVTMAAANSYETLRAMKTRLRVNNVETSNAAYFVTPSVVEFLEIGTWLNATEIGVKDRKAGLRGNVTGMQVRESNNIPYYVDLDIATQPTDGDTVSITGGSYTNTSTGAPVTPTVTFTFKTTLTPTAGEVLIGASAATALTNLTSAIQGTGTAGTDYVAISAVNRQALDDAFVYAIEEFSGSMSVFSNLELTVAETLTDATDAWNTADRGRVIFAMDRMAVNVADQMTEMKVTDATEAFRMHLLGEYVYGGKVLGENSKRIVTNRIKNA